MFDIDFIKFELEQIFGSMAATEVTCGEKFTNNSVNIELYSAWQGWQGLYYKDEEAYNSDLDKVCYIPEHDFGDYLLNLSNAIHEYNQRRKKENWSYEYGQGHTAEEKLRTNIQNIKVGYTHRDLLEMCNNQEEVVKAVFDTVDWQNPETYFDEMFRTNELAEYDDKLVLTGGMSLKEFLYDKYKEDWLKQRNITGLIDEKKGLNGEHYSSFEEFCEKEFTDKECILNLIEKKDDNGVLEDKIKNASKIVNSSGRNEEGMNSRTVKEEKEY